MRTGTGLLAGSAVAALLLGRVLLAQDGGKNLQELLHDMHVAESWTYDDLPAAREAARAQSKPLFVVFR